ncbi:coil containing protein [Vibrio phage 1.084.O._10N.261.49.F5]|nr:coil containing protein [Vibrio phage 1.084.O._10N.261.49.F5]
MTMKFGNKGFTPSSYFEKKVDPYKDIDMKCFEEAKKLSGLLLYYSEYDTFRNLILGTPLPIPSDEKVMTFIYVEEAIELNGDDNLFDILSAYKPDTMEDILKVEFEPSGAYEGGIHLKVFGIDYSDDYKKYLNHSKYAPKFLHIYNELLEAKNEQQCIREQIAELQKKLK